MVKASPIPILFLGLLIIISSASLCSAVEQEIGPFKSGEYVDLFQTCSNCTYVNITSVRNEDSVILLSNIEMDTTDSVEYNYTFCNTSSLGYYTVNGFGDVDAVRTVWAYSFEVTPQGEERINQGEGLFFTTAIAFMFLLVVLFFILTFAAKSLAFKIIFGGLAGLFILISILFLLVGFEQILGGYDVLMEGYATFWMVIKVMVGISILGLILSSGWLSFKYWKWKRGLS